MVIAFFSDTPPPPPAGTDEKRGAMMKAQLQVIKDTEGVSKDVYEIASKSLV